MRETRLTQWLLRVTPSLFWVVTLGVLGCILDLCIHLALSRQQEVDLQYIGFGCGVF